MCAALAGRADATHTTSHPVQLRLRHLEALCTPPDQVGPPCAGDPRLGQFPGLVNLAAFDYGSAPGRLRYYSGPGWRLMPALPDGVSVGSYVGELDLLCDGSVDTLADEFSAPPVYAPYHVVLDNDRDGDAVPNEPLDDLQAWLLPHLPTPSIYPPLQRADASADYVWLGGQTSATLAEPEGLTIATQRVTWSPAHPNTGLGALVTSVVLGPAGRPTPPDCRQPLASWTLPIYGYVDTDGDQSPETEAAGNPPPAGADANSDTVDDNAGYYLRWTVGVAADPVQWRRDQPYDNLYHGRRLDVSLIVRCYYISEDNSAPPSGSDDDGDCLEDPATAQPTRPTDANDSNADRDGDALLDGLEVAWGSDPAASDTDADSLSDALELAMLTNPNAKDTDADGKWDAVDNCPLDANNDQADADNDGWLVAYAVFRRGVIGPSVSPQSTDALGTPLEQATDLAQGTLLVPSHMVDPLTGGNACDGDADGDLLIDAAECPQGAGSPPPCQTAPPAVALVLHDEEPLVDNGDPAGGPPDGNRANDLQDAGLRCVAADADGDGVMELPAAGVFTFQTDSDGDGYPDGVECLLGSAPGSGQVTNLYPPGGSSPIDGAASTPECAVAGGDGDGDGRTDDCTDADADGVGDRFERQLRHECARVDPGGGIGTACNPSLAQEDLNADTVPDIDSDADDDGLPGRSDGDSDGDSRGDLTELRTPGFASTVHVDSDGDGCPDDFEVNRAAMAQGDPSRPRQGADFFDNNRDRVVAVVDISRVVTHFGKSILAGTYVSNQFDANLDGSITVGDISRVVIQFGISCRF